MTAYAQSNYAGPPTGGRYVVGDSVTDMNGTRWLCVKAGWPGEFSPQDDPTVAATYSLVEFIGNAADTVRFKSNVTGATWTLTNTTAGDGKAHKVTIKGDAATDHSLKTAALVGTDANGLAQTETINLPNGTATVTSTKEFLTLTSVTPSATIGGDTMDIGIASRMPTAAAGYRGKFRLEGRPSVGKDLLYVCIDSDGSGTYAWQAVTTA